MIITLGMRVKQMRRPSEEQRERVKEIER